MVPSYEIFEFSPLLKLKIIYLILGSASKRAGLLLEKPIMPNTNVGSKLKVKTNSFGFPTIFNYKKLTASIYSKLSF